MNEPRSPAAGREDGAAAPGTEHRVRGRLLVASALLIAGFLLTFPLDFSAYQALERIDHPLFQQAAQQFSFWGDYFPGSVLVSVILFTGGLLARNRRIRSAALASLLAATCAGLSVDACRFSFGRPRPYATAAVAALQLGRAPEVKVSFGRTRPGTDLPDGFYGPVGIHMFQGFPSGHATSSTASAVAVLPLVPEIGIPLTLLAAGVCWSRMELRQHYLSDVAVGALWGALWGIGFGRLLLGRLPPRPKPAPASPRHAWLERKRGQSR